MHLSMDNTFDDGEILIWDLHDKLGPEISKPDDTVTQMTKKYYDAGLALHPKPRGNEGVELVLEVPSLPPVLKRLKQPIRLSDVVGAIRNVYNQKIKAKEYTEVLKHDDWSHLGLQNLKKEINTYGDLLLDHSFLEGFEVDKNKLYLRLGS
jgi:hypothetical protein